MERKSASAAIRSAITAAAGVSTITPSLGQADAHRRREFGKDGAHGPDFRQGGHHGQHHLDLASGAHPQDGAQLRA